MLLVDPKPGITIAIGKNIPNQNSGLIFFEFEVQVNDATQPSVAKIEMVTISNAGWDKKFQLYFGSGMRVNYSSSGSAASIVSSTESGRWYSIRCQMDISSGLLKIWVDGLVAVENIPMHPGSLTALSIWGWDRAGSVNFDNLLGTK